MNRTASIMLAMAGVLACCPAQSDSSIGSIAQRESIAGGTSIQQLNVGTDSQQKERATRTSGDERDVCEIRPAKIGRFRGSAGWDAVGGNGYSGRLSTQVRADS